MNALRRFNFYPLLLGVYPVVALMAHNVDQASVSEAVRALLISFAGAVILLLLLKLVLRDWHNASLVCALSIVLFYSYGHIYFILEMVDILGYQVGRHRFLIPVWIGILVLGSWWVVRGLRKPSQLAQALNVTAALALVLPLFQIISFQVRLKVAQSEVGELTSNGCHLNLSMGQTPPDIYYIILDGYPREDVLQNVYGYDNKDFIDALTQMGFYVVGKGQSNYAFSALSLASSLNFNYLDALGDGVVPGSEDRLWLLPIIQSNASRQELECLGYSFIAFKTGYYATQIKDADIYFTPRQEVLYELQAFGELNGFEAMLIQSSAALIITDATIILPKFLMPDVKVPFKNHREIILNILDRLEDLPEIPGPKFVFAHIISPHAPYIFGPESEHINPTEMFTLGGDREEGTPEYHINGYHNQINFINRRLEWLLPHIISRSETPPIIILQADHGGPLGNRMAILNAYHFPDSGSEFLYETITPVNTFRLLFNIYFSGEYELLEDVSYSSSYNDPYNFIVIGN
jgi:hypothetical protein